MGHLLHLAHNVLHHYPTSAGGAFLGGIAGYFLLLPISNGDICSSSLLLGPCTNLLHSNVGGLVGSIDPVLGGLAGVLLGAFIGFFFRIPEPK